MKEKTINNSNFVQFVHEVVSAVKEGYTLTLDPQHAPNSTPYYTVTLVQEEIEIEVEPTLEVVENETIQKTPETVETQVVQEVAKKQGRPARK